MSAGPGAGGTSISLPAGSGPDVVATSLAPISTATDSVPMVSEGETSNASRRSTVNSSAFATSLALLTFTTTASLRDGVQQTHPTFVVAAAALTTTSPSATQPTYSWSGSWAWANTTSANGSLLLDNYSDAHGAGSRTITSGGSASVRPALTLLGISFAHFIANFPCCSCPLLHGQTL